MNRSRFTCALLIAVGVLAGCSSATSSPATCTDSMCAGDASAAVDSSTDAAMSADAHASDASCPPYVDDASVTHGCNQGGQGPGDRDDGGGMDALVPDVAMDAQNLPFGSPCWDNAQCTSSVCYDYKARGQFCTKTCSSNADCPDPTVGCNGMGFCRMGN